MALRTTDYGNLTSWTTMIDEVFNDAMADALADTVYEDVFGISSTMHKSNTTQLNHGLSGVAKVAEGANYPTASGEEGDSITQTQSKYGADVVITYEARKFDDYDQVVDNLTSIVDEGVNMIDQAFAWMLTEGTATSHVDPFGETISTVGPDGLGLFSASHTNGTTGNTFSNVITNEADTANPALSHSALIEMRSRGLTYTDPQGVNRPINYDTLLVPPQLEALARRLVESDYLPGGGNNDINPIKNMYKIKVWSKLGTGPSAGDRSARRYIYDSRKVKKSLKGYFADVPVLLPPQEFDPNRNWHYIFHFMFSRGFGRPAYIAGSTGAN